MENKHFIHVHNPEGTGKKLLVLGGDITVSGKGFAKGVKYKESDYVHKIIRFCQEAVRDFGFCVMQSHTWEQNYKNSEGVIKLYRDGEKFNADIIIFQIGDHIEKDGFDEKTFKEQFEKLVYFVDPFRRSKIVILTSFSKNVSDGALQEMAERFGCACIYLGNVRDHQKLCDGGLPNKDGMDMIARSVLCIIENHLKK